MLPMDWSTGALAEGLACYARADYFNAHEYWEELWRQSQGEQKHLLQAHIHLAVGLCHEQRGNSRGALAQMRKAIAHLEHCPPYLEGVDVLQLQAEIKPWIQWFEDPAEGKPLIPQVGPRE